MAGEFAGNYFVQRISLDLGERTRRDVARDWVRKLTDAIREVDDEHLITVGVIPWAHVFKNAKPIFYDAEVGRPLDFVSVHFYPKTGKVDEAVRALKVYELGKPLVVEEFFPLHCSLEEASEFVNATRPLVDGWVSFYWGVTSDEYVQRDNVTSGLMVKWLRWFQSHAPAEE